MTVQRHDRSHPYIERTFTAVRAALPAANVAAFDTELEAITHAPVVDLAALDEFLSGWWRIATRAAADPADWQRLHQEAEQLQSGARPAGPTLAEVLGRLVKIRSGYKYRIEVYYEATLTGDLSSLSLDPREILEARLFRPDDLPTAMPDLHRELAAL
jgi:Family of unknown function (DUF6247)